MTRKQLIKKESHAGLVKKLAPTGRQWVDMDFLPATKVELAALYESFGGEENIPVGYTAGWASTADRDYYEHVVMPGAFDASISRKGFLGPKGIRLLIQHDRDRIGGVIKRLRTVGDKLWIEAQLNMESSVVKDFYSSAKMVGGLNFSVGFFIEDYRYEEKDDEFTLFIDKGELEEVSIVTFPGNPEAVMTYLKEAPVESEYQSIAEFEKALVQGGLAKNRNAAHRVALVVKQNLALFLPAAVTPKPAPVAKAKLDALSALVGELKGLF